MWGTIMQGQYNNGPISNNSALVQIMAWRRMATSLIWTNVGLIYWRIYALFGPDELIYFSHFVTVCRMKMKNQTLKIAKQM